MDLFCPGDPCLICSSDTFDQDLLSKILPSKILCLPDLEFVVADNNPVAQTNFYLAALTCNVMVSKFISKVILADPEVEVLTRSILTVNNLDGFNMAVERESKCLFCKDTGKI